MAGIDQTGPTFGSEWGFFNHDAYPDLWVNHHQFKPSLFLNRGDGTFTDIVDLVWNANPRKDTHGAAWGDFDNDGDQDLVETSGGLRGFMTSPDPRFGNNFYVNESQHLVEKAQDYGLAFPYTRARHALWLDMDSDGLLDVALSSVDSKKQAFLMMHQTPEGFVDVTKKLGMVISKSSAFSSLADVTGDGRLDLLVHAPAYPAAVFDLSSGQPKDVLPTLNLPETTKTKDVVIADFDGDLRSDLYVVRFSLRSSQWIQRRPNNLQVHLFEAKGKEAGISFASKGEVRFRLEPAWKYGVTPDKIFIGSEGVHPKSSSFALASDDEQAHGIAPHEPGKDMGVYIGFDSSTGRWMLLHSKTSEDDLDKLTGYVSGESPITDVQAIGFDPGRSALTDRLFLQREDGFERADPAFGLNKPTNCHTGVAADFDNDMDQDLYLVCTGVIGNAPNRLFENIDNRRFVEVKGAGGAAGSDLGVGDSVTTADYDNDGFMDLFVTNGFGPKPFHNGPEQLFHNTGNANHWILLRLIGTISNRDAVGARVVVTTPDGRRQLREQGGGIHWKCQNDQRLHFGLGANKSIDRIEIRWPSGLKQTLRDVAADQLLEVREGKAAGAPGIGARPLHRPRSRR